MFSSRLTQLREERGLTRKEVAEQLNIDQTTYGKYELAKRQPDYGTLEKIASFYYTSIDYLLGRTNVRPLDKANEDWPDDAQVLMRSYKKLTPKQQEIVLKLIQEFIDEE